MATLSSSLSSPLDIQGETALIKHFWHKDLHHGNIESYGPYFAYYTTECRRLQLGLPAGNWESTKIAATTHEDVVYIVQTLSNARSERRPAIRKLLQQRFPSADGGVMNRSIDFAIRVWLTMNVREERMHTPHTTALHWDDAMTLEAFVTRNFPRVLNQSSAELLTLDHTFTAANLSRLSGISIEWTPCLADHLRFERKDKVLKVYPFKQILLNMVHLWEKPNFDGHQAPRPPIQLSVLKETIMSLNLLFPHWDRQTAKLMRQHNHIFHLEGPFDPPRLLNASDFDHWRGRILQLHQIYHSQPTEWPQLWADRRNPLQWYTFWLAIVILVLTVVFGCISSVTSLMQTYYAREALEIARSQ